MKLVIGNKNYSSWSLRPWLLLSVHGVPFEEIRIPLDTDATRAAIAKYSDAGKVPVLVDGDLTVWDSLAICEYVSECYLDGKGWPDTPQARAEARSCSAEMHSGFSELRTKLPMNCRASGRQVAPTPELDRDIARIDSLWSGFRKKYASQGPWLFGAFTIADCMFAPVVCRFRTYGVALSGTASEYMEHALADETMMLWLQQAQAETETVHADEAGSL